MYRKASPPPRASKFGPPTGNKYGIQSRDIFRGISKKEYSSPIAPRPPTPTPPSSSTIDPPTPQYQVSPWISLANLLCFSKTRLAYTSPKLNPPINSNAASDPTTFL